MKNWTHKLSSVNISRLFLAIFYSVGIAGLTLPSTQGLFQKLIPLNLIVSNVLLFYFHSKWTAKHGWVFFGLALGGYFIEVAGVATGLIFGEYSYGGSLGLKLFSTPLLIGLNWLMLVYGAYLLFPAINNRWYYPLLGAFILVVYDFVMEPVAIATDMWNWGGGAIPLQNYAAWFIIAAIMLLVLQKMRIKYSNPLAVWLLAIQFLFFLILRFTIV